MATRSRQTHPDLRWLAYPQSGVCSACSLLSFSSSFHEVLSLFEGGPFPFSSFAVLLVTPFTFLKLVFTNGQPTWLSASPNTNCTFALSVKLL